MNWGQGRSLFICLKEKKREKLNCQIYFRHKKQVLNLQRNNGILFSCADVKNKPHCDHGVGQRSRSAEKSFFPHNACNRSGRGGRGRAGITETGRAAGVGNKGSSWFHKPRERCPHLQESCSALVLPALQSTKWACCGVKSLCVSLRWRLEERLLYNAGLSRALGCWGRGC